MDRGRESLEALRMFRRLYLGMSIGRRDRWEDVISQKLTVAVNGVDVRAEREDRLSPNPSVEPQ